MPKAPAASAPPDDSCAAVRARMPSILTDTVGHLLNHVRMVASTGQVPPPPAVSCTQEFAVRHGVLFPTVALGDTKLTRHCRPQACFYNARTLARRHPDRFLYCEGFACAVIVTEHAWLYDLKEQLAVEVTWDEIGVGYVGVPFSAAFCRREPMDPQNFCLLNQWHRHHPLLRGVRTDFKHPEPLHGTQPLPPLEPRKIAPPKT